MCTNARVFMFNYAKAPIYRASMNVISFHQFGLSMCTTTLFFHLENSSWRSFSLSLLTRIYFGEFFLLLLPLLYLTYSCVGCFQHFLILSTKTHRRNTTFILTEFILQFRFVYSLWPMLAYFSVCMYCCCSSCIDQLLMDLHRTQTAESDSCGRQKQYNSVINVLQFV